MSTRFEWDHAKNDANQRKHGLRFEDAKPIFIWEADRLDERDETHGVDEERFISVAPIASGLITVVWTEASGRPRADHQRSTILQAGATPLSPIQSGFLLLMTDDLDIRELTEADFRRMIPAPVRRRIREGRIESGRDIILLRRFVGLSQKEFARALEISVHTLRNWEQGRRQPEGPAIALLKIAARHPHIFLRAAGHGPSPERATR